VKTKDKNTAHTNNNTKKSARITTKKVARKAARKITNWSAYNNALKSRGNLSIFLAEDVFKQDALVLKLLIKQNDETPKMFLSKMR